LGVKEFHNAELTWTYHWFLANLSDGQEPKLGEPDTFSHCKYVPINELGQHKLSANMQNLKEEIEQGRIHLKT